MMPRAWAAWMRSVLRVESYLSRLL
eukprot:COSAG01_NODE_72628_length_252_cov_1.013072_2_plen_24_part_01